MKYKSTVEVDVHASTLDLKAEILMTPAIGAPVPAELEVQGLFFMDGTPIPNTLRAMIPDDMIIAQIDGAAWEEYQRRTQPNPDRLREDREERRRAFQGPVRRRK